MKLQFGVAICCHCTGANPDYLTKDRFATYEEADKFAEMYREECEPTIYVILNDKYVFHCERSAVENQPYKIYHLKIFKEGQIETRIWWKEFTKHPLDFVHLAQAIL